MEQEIKEQTKKENNKHSKKEEIKLLEEKLTTLEEENKTLKDEALRTKAELINYRKRKDEEVSQYLKYAGSDIITSMLSIIDNFERALNIKEDNLSDEVKSFLSGYKLIYQSLKEVLASYGVKEIEALNKPFDSKLHNCLFTEENNEIENDIVTEVITKGYTYHDKILRCASVKVNINNNENKEKEDDNNE